MVIYSQFSLKITISPTKTYVHSFSKFYFSQNFKFRSISPSLAQALYHSHLVKFNLDFASFFKVTSKCWTIFILLTDTEGYSQLVCQPHLIHSHKAKSFHIFNNIGIHFKFCLILFFLKHPSSLPNFRFLQSVLWNQNGRHLVCLRIFKWKYLLKCWVIGIEIKIWDQRCFIS